MAERGLDQVNRCAVIEGVRCVCVTKPVWADAASNASPFGRPAQDESHAPAVQAFAVTRQEDETLGAAPPRRAVNSDHMAVGSAMARVLPFLPNTVICPASPRGHRWSEFPAVVIPVATQQYMLLQRNLIYTGITRGKELVVVVGQRRALRMAISNNRTQRRYSGLE